MNILEAKARLRIPELWRRLDLPGEPRTSCRSPFRNDRRASFSVSRDGLLFHDFATDEAGDSIDFLQRATGLSRAAACKNFIELAGGSGSLPQPRLLGAAAVYGRRQRPKFPNFQKGRGPDLKRLARLRNLSVEGLELISERGLLRFGNLRGFDAWIITDVERVNAQARRMDGGVWEHLRSKSWTLRDSWAGWPIGTKEAQPLEKLALVEGGGDLLAAFHFIFCEDRERDVAPVAMLGASQRIHEDALALFAGKRIRLFPHLDNAGQAAAERWTRQLEAVGAEVDAFDFASLHRTGGEPVGDLNDLSSICPDDFEIERETWMVMP